MTTIRSFIAIELSNEARVALADLQDRLKAVVPPKTVRWTAPQSIHLTLHFLGNITANEVVKVTEIVQSVAPAHKTLFLTLEGLGCFPNMRRPRIVWVGVLGATDSLVKVHQDLGQKLRVIDFKPETRPYSPHLTIGRVKKGVRPRQLSRLGQILDQERAKVGQLATLAVTEISLMKSELKPVGAVYTQLARGVMK